MPGPVRRVVTGHDAHGRAVVSSDGAPPVVMDSPLQKGLRFTEVWNTRTSPAPIDNAADPTQSRSLRTAADAGGTVIRIVDMPPEGPNGPDVSPDQAKALLAGVGLHYHGHPKHPFMHRTETIDYGIVLSGEIWLVLDDEEVHLRPGDIVVQRGTIHAWSNRGTEVCRMAFVLIDGKFSDEVPKG